MLRLLARSLESLVLFLPSSETYESTDDTESLLRFLSESVNLGRGEGEREKEGLALRRTEFLRGGDCEALGDLGLRAFVSRLGRGDGDRDRDMLVDMVDTEPEEADRILFEGPGTSKSSLCLSRFRPLSSSSLASCSSATPFLEIAIRLAKTTAKS